MGAQGEEVDASLTRIIVDDYGDLVVNSLTYSLTSIPLGGMVDLL